MRWSRSKTGKGNGLSYQLWGEILKLLRQYRSKHPTLALTTTAGTPLWTSSHQDGGRERKFDSIGLNFRRWRQRVGLDLPDLKDLRKTGRNKLEEHSEFARYGREFLQHSARSVDEKWYRKPTQAQFDAAIRWLGEQYGL